MIKLFAKTSLPRGAGMAKILWLIPEDMNKCLLLFCVKQPGSKPFWRRAGQRHR